MHNSRANARPFFPLALSLLLALLLAGCGGGGGSSDSTFTGATPSTTSPTPTPLSASVATPSGLTATLSEDRATATTGGAVTYALTLTNNTARTISVSTFIGIPPVGATLQVMDPTGHAVFIDPLEFSNVFPPPAVGNITLAPGQSASETLPVANAFTAPGKYSATSTFTTQLNNGDAFYAGQATTTGPLIVTVQ